MIATIGRDTRPRSKLGSGIESPRDKQARYRIQMQRSGRCPRCGKPAAPYLECDRHRKLRREYRRSRYHRIKPDSGFYGVMAAERPRLGATGSAAKKLRRAQHRELLEAIAASAHAPLPLELEGDDVLRYLEIRKLKIASDPLRTEVK